MPIPDDPNPSISFLRQRGWRRREIMPALALGGVAGAAGTALAFADARSGGDHGLDAAILRALREPGALADPVGPAWVEEAARDITGLGGIVVLAFVVLAATVYLWLSGRRAAGGVLAAAGAGAAVLGIALKAVFDRPRPDVVPHAVAVFDASFPSGHATGAAAVYLALGALLARAEVDPVAKAWLVGIGMVLAGAVAASRVYLGVHWPTDVLAGLAIGAAWAAVCWAGELALQQHGLIAPTPDR